MSGPAIFVLVNEGNKRVYSDNWAGAMLYREIVYGPRALEDYTASMDVLDDQELEHFESGEGIIVNFDERTMCWADDSPEQFEIAKVREVYNRLLQGAWQNYSIQHAPAGINFSTLAPVSIGNGDVDDDPEYFEDRIETVEEAAEEFAELEDDERRAWTTIIAPQGKKLHRCLSELPQAFLNPDKKLAKKISQGISVEVPAEKVTFEGVVIDIGNRSLAIWGQKDLKGQFNNLASAWKGWSVQWLENGYLEHCELAGVEPNRLNEAEALAEIVPLILSNKRFDMSMLVGAIGGGLRGWAVKATGCFYILICIPILIFALFTGMWTECLLTMGVTLIVFVAVFKFFEYRFKRSFNKAMPANKMSTAEEDDRPHTAGPEDIESREEHISQLLAATGLPTLGEIKKHYDAETFEMMYQ